MQDQKEMGAPISSKGKDLHKLFGNLEQDRKRAKGKRGFPAFTFSWNAVLCQCTCVIPSRMVVVGGSNIYTPFEEKSIWGFCEEQRGYSERCSERESKVGEEMEGEEHGRGGLEEEEIVCACCKPRLSGQASSFLP